MKDLKSRFAQGSGSVQLNSMVILASMMISKPLMAAEGYRLDDGSAENNVGVGEPPFGLACLNQFTAQDGALTIDSLSIAWGAVPAGTPATVLVYRDPNQDGNPNDAEWVYGGLVSTGSPDDDEFSTYAISAQTFSPGESFFVGFWLQAPPGGWHPAAFDQDEPQGRSWLVISFENFFINDLSSNFLPPTPVEEVAGLGAGNWMIRANSVPGPGALGLLLVARLGAKSRRRR